MVTQSYNSSSIVSPYYSSVPGWRPATNPNATVVYVDKNGKTTGEISTSAGTGSIEKGVKASNISNVSVDIRPQNNVDPSSANVYQPVSAPSSSPGIQKVFSSLNDKQAFTGDTQYSYGRVSSISSNNNPIGKSYGNINKGNSTPLLITPQESSQNPTISSYAPVWVMQSPNTKVGIVQAGDVESLYANVPVYRPIEGMPYSKGYYEVNQAAIGRASFDFQVKINPKLSGTQTPEYSAFQMNARNDFYKLPFKDQLRLESGEAFYGAMKFGEGTKSFIAHTNLATAFSMGRYEVKDGKVTGGDIAQTFSKIDVPTVPHIKGQNYIVELVTERPAAGFTFGASTALGYIAGADTIKNVQSFGIKQGVGTSLASFSPINLEASGGWDISKRLTDSPPSSKKVSFIGENGVTTQIMETKVPATLGGENLGIRIRNIQLSSVEGKGFGIQETRSPIWTYRGGVLSITPTTQKSLIQFSSTGLNGIFDVNSYSSSGIRNSKVSGIDQNMFKSEFVSIGRFASGEVGTRLNKVTLPQETYYAVESGFKTQFKGYSVTFGKPSSFESEEGGSSFLFKSGGGMQTKTTSLKGFEVPIMTSSFERQSPSIIQSKSINLPVSAFMTSTKTSLASQTKQVQRTSLSTIPIQSTMVVSDVTSTFSKTSLASRTSMISLSGFNQVESQSTKQIFSFPGTTRTNILPVSSSNFPSSSFNYPDFQSLSSQYVPPKKYKSKQRTKYTPDFLALSFNIKGKPNKSGFGLRPIIKGFKWSF